MTALLSVEVFVIVAAFVGMLWLRRESDRHWAIYCATRPVREALVRFQIQIRDSLTPALRKFASSLADAAPAFERLAKAMKGGRRPMSVYIFTLAAWVFLADCVVAAAQR